MCRFINFSKSCNGTSTMDANLVRELPKLQNFFQTNLLTTNLLILNLKLRLLVNRRQVQIQQPFQLQKTTQDNHEIVLIKSIKLVFKQETAFIKKTFLKKPVNRLKLSSYHTAIPAYIFLTKTFVKYTHSIFYKTWNFCKNLQFSL